MRLLVWCGIILVFFGAAARAEAPRPAEMPPREFAGAQYIDSTGCVFRRDGSAWVAVLTDDDTQTCGFPPSRTVWADQVVAPAGADAATIERELMMLTVVENGAGMAVQRADAERTVLPGTPNEDAVAAPATTGTGASPAADGVAAEISRGLKASRQIGGMSSASGAGDDRLCALLGLQGPGADPAATGDDPTGGLCSGRAAKIAAYHPRLAGAADAAATAREGGAQKGVPASGMGVGRLAGPGASATATRKAGAETSSGQMGQKAAKGQGGSVARSGNRQAKVAPAAVEMVAPGARYVQIGRFDDAGAKAATDALLRRGYPVVRETRQGADGRRYVMAGPFPTRAGLIAALDTIRKAGFGAAVAR